MLFARESGQWRGPAFYTLATASVGFQAGVAVSETVTLVMTEKGMNSMLSANFRLGGDASIAAGPVGVGGLIEDGVDPETQEQEPEGLEDDEDAARPVGHVGVLPLDVDVIAVIAGGGIAEEGRVVRIAQVHYAESVFATGYVGESASRLVGPRRRCHDMPLGRSDVTSTGGHRGRVTSVEYPPPFLGVHDGCVGILPHQEQHLRHGRF